MENVIPNDSFHTKGGVHTLAPSSLPLDPPMLVPQAHLDVKESVTVARQPEDIIFDAVGLYAYSPEGM